MRSLTECKAEIFSRSEKKIKGRNRIRKSIVSWCVAFAVCFGVGAGIVQIWPRNKCTSVPKGSIEEDTRGEKEEGGSTAAVAVRVKIKSADGTVGESYYEKEPQGVLDLYTSIQSLYENTTDGESDNYASQVGGNEEKNGYLIVFQMSNGLEKKFLLNGFTLTNEESNETIILTDAQLKRLKEELYIIE